MRSLLSIENTASSCCCCLSCCLRSLLSSLERVRKTDGFSRTDGYIASTWWNYHQHSVCCSLLWRDIISTPRLLSVLLRMFSTIERYHHHLKEHYQYCRRCSSHWRGKWMIDLLMSFCSTYDISPRRYPLRSTDGIINLRLLQRTSQEALLDFDDGYPMAIGFASDRIQLTGQV